MKKNLSNTEKLYSKLRTNMLFLTVPTSQLHELSFMFQEQTYAPGDFIFREGDTDNTLCLIAEGMVSISKITSFGEETELAVLEKNEFFGEFELIDGLPRSATAKALMKTEILKLDYDTFHLLLEENHIVVLNVLKQLSKRLRETNETVVKQVEATKKTAQERIDILTFLFESTQKLKSSLDLDELLDIILETAVKGTNADRGTLYLIDYEKDEIWSKVLKGESISEIRMPLGKGIAGYVAATGDVIYTEDAYKDPRFNPEIDRISGYKTRSMLCMPMKDKNGKIIGVFQMINKLPELFRKEDEKFIEALSVHASIAIENAQATREMILQEQFSTVCKLAGSLLHDIKDPIHTFSIYTESLKKGSDSKDSIILVEKIGHQMQRLATTVQEIRDLCRNVSSTSMKNILIGDLIDKILPEINTELEKNRIHLNLQLEYTGDCVLDPEKMERVFHTLIDNASEAMQERNTKVLTIAIESKNDNLYITFRDTGTGIPEGIRNKIFNPFFTFGKKDNMGLGLSIVKKIIEEHNGIIDVESEEGKGTKIFIVLPLRLRSPFLQ
jgi:signal transduction histidine kinase/CRP-like cAMP-binding protein